MASKEPAEAPAFCPECGVDLTGRNPWAHALDHWPEHLDPRISSEKAIERQKFLKDLARKRGLL